MSHQDKTQTEISSSVAKFANMDHFGSRVKICVSGAAETGRCGLDVFDVAKEVGREIARQGAVLVSGATTGFPLYAAIGAKEENGFTIGFSPAATEREHVEVYKLPLDYMDVIVYTGFGFVGRDILNVRSADALIAGCGRIGTIHEFAVAYEDHRPIGILQGSWETDEVLKHMIDASGRPAGQIIYDTSPKNIIAKLIEMVKQQRAGANYLYNNHDVPIPPKSGEVIL